MRLMNLIFQIDIYILRGSYTDIMDFRYPKDAEKHLLAVRSGLTRNQVPLHLILAF